MPNIVGYNNGVRFDILVKPNAKKQGISISRKNGIVISVVNAAVGGKANKDLVKLLKRLLGTDVFVHKTKKNHQKTMFASDISVERFKELIKIR